MGTYRSFRHCRVFIDIILCDLFSILPWSRLLPHPTHAEIESQRRKGTQGHDSEQWHLDLCGDLTSCIPFSCSQRHTLVTFSMLLAFWGALQDPASAPLGFYRRKRGCSPMAKVVSSTLAISALAIIPKFKNSIVHSTQINLSFLVLLTAFFLNRADYPSREL